jgi:hypothetical protein
MIYAGILWIALECVRRGYGERRIDANYVPDVLNAAGSGHRGVTGLKLSNHLLSANLKSRVRVPMCPCATSVIRARK